MEPGDIIITGTPPGVGARHEAAEFLKVGDVVDARHRRARRAEAEDRQAARLTRRGRQKQKPRAKARGFQLCAFGSASAQNREKIGPENL